MRLAYPALCLSYVVSVAAGDSAWAGVALDADKAPAKADQLDCSKPGNEAQCHTVTTPEVPQEVEYGLGVRLRSVWVPKSVLELFVDRSAGGAQNFGLGVDLTRRRGTTELQLGFEYERVNVGQGVWINKGDDVANGDEADYVLSPNSSGHQLGWFTIEFTFLNHAEITKWLSFRYGGGIGLGVIIGELDHYNVLCNGATNANPEPGCVPDRFNGTATYTEPGGPTPVAYDLPPVFPVVNAILGFQLKPSDKMTINIEGGIRTLPFFGVSSSYFF
jgi:hypothetical protein